MFYRDWYEPQDGYYEPPAVFGYELNEGKKKRRTEL